MRPLLFATLFVLFVSLTSGCGRQPANATTTTPPAAVPEPLLLAFCDRSASEAQADWSVHTGMVKLVMDEFAYEGFHAYVYSFGSQFGSIYQGKPSDWESEIGPALIKHVKSGAVMSSKGTFGVPVFKQALELIRINADHPVFMMVMTDGLLNDMDGSRGALRQLLAQQNLKKFVMGPIVEDPVKRHEVMSRLLPGPQPVDRVMIKSRLDLEDALREAADDFHREHVPSQF